LRQYTSAPKLKSDAERNRRKETPMEAVDENSQNGGPTVDGSRRGGPGSAGLPENSDVSPRGRRGGPVSAVGKQRSRTNAVRHGLTATTLIDEIFGPANLQRVRHALVEEWRPATPTEGHLVDELARHAAELELAERAEEAVLRSGAPGLRDC
jgi:hypothetical protein